MFLTLAQGGLWLAALPSHPFTMGIFEYLLCAKPLQDTEDTAEDDMWQPQALLGTAHGLAEVSDRKTHGGTWPREPKRQLEVSPGRLAV